MYMYNLRHMCNSSQNTSLKENIHQVKEELVIALKIKQEDLSFCLSVHKRKTKCLRVGEARFFPKQEGSLPAKHRVEAQPCAGWQRCIFYILQRHLAKEIKHRTGKRLLKDTFYMLNVKFINNF